MSLLVVGVDHHTSDLDLLERLAVPSDQRRKALRELVATGAGIGFLSEAEFGHDTRLRKLHLTGVDLGMAETLITLTARRDVAVIRAFLRSMG